MIARRILAALALLCVLIAPAHAQKSKATLDTEVATSWPDNSTGVITPSALRTTVLDVINSYVDWLSCTGSGGIVYWNAGTPTCLTAGSNGQTLGLSAGLPAWVNMAANLTAGTGITLTGTINVTVSLTNQISAGGPTGSGTAVPVITYNAQGQVTAVSTATVTPALTSITGVSANSFVGNNTGSPANAASLSAGQAGAMLCVPSRSVFPSGTASTYTTPTCNGVIATWLEVDVQGGGAGGAGSGTTATAPTVSTAGNASVFGALTANGGGASLGSAAAAIGGTCSGSLGTQQNYPGSDANGTSLQPAVAVPGGMGGNSFYGGAGAGTENAAGSNAKTNSGSGGGGGGGNTTATVIAAGGGAPGCHIRTLITSPAATYTYTVGGTAAGASAGTSGFAGGLGAAGLIDVIAHWQ